MGQRIARVRVVLSGWTGGPGLSTFYYRPEVVDEVPLLAMAQACADGVRAAFLNLDGIFPTNVTATVSPEVDVLDSATGILEDSLVVSPPAAVTPGGGAVSGPTASMMCLGWLTGTFVNGRRLRGRTFLGPLKDSVNNNGAPAAAALVQLNEFYDDIDITPYHRVVWHRPISGAGGVAGDVTGVSIKPKFAVLTSRRD